LPWPKLAVITPLVVAMLFGGFAGSVFTWWVNSPSATTVIYNVTTTALGNDPAVRSACRICDLISARRKYPPFSYTRVELSVPTGPYLRRGEVVVTFPGASVGGLTVVTRTFGFADRVRRLSIELTCAAYRNGVRCTMGPLSPKHPATFRLTFATDRGVGRGSNQPTRKSNWFRCKSTLGAQSSGRCRLAIFWYPSRYF